MARVQQHPFDQGVTGCETGQETRTSGAKEAAEKVVVAKKSGAKSRGIPHLAKNERDMGHPGSFLGRMKKSASEAKAGYSRDNLWHG